MGLKGSIQAAAKAAVLTDAADLQGLVSLSELLRQLASDATAEGSPEIAVRSNEAAELSDLIILRQVNDVDAAFRRVVEAIGACETASERADAPRREPPDPELLVAWIASCEGTIPDIEHLAVKAESQGFVGETAAEIRRRIHTLKGECGVLSLSQAQSDCHDLESLIDGAALIARDLAAAERTPDAVQDLRSRFAHAARLFFHCAWNVPPAGGAGRSRKRVQPPARGIAR